MGVRVRPNKRLTIERKRQTSDSDWVDQPENWEYVGTEWFQIKPLNGRELEQARQMQSMTTHTAMCVYFKGASTRYRLRECERIWEVQSVVNVEEANRHLEWRLTELEPDA